MTADGAIAGVARPLRDAGLDVLQPFDAAWYDARIAAVPDLSPLPRFGRRRALALLVGNTRALWPRFLDAFRRSDALRRSPDPLDGYVAAAVREAVGRIPVRTVVRFAHDRGPGLVSMLRVAEASGLARIGPAHLAVHPTLGPWFSLRAVIVVDADPPAGPPPVAPDPCAGCDAPCRRAFDAAVAAGAGLPGGWRAWVAVRDACPVGRAHRYGDDQIRYHYTKDRDGLRAAAGEVP